MASFIQQSCTSCADCESVCPTFSIFRGRNQFVIDTDTCEDCGFCSLACQVSAIVSKPEVKVEVKADTEPAGKKS